MLHHQDGQITLHCGDALTVARDLPDAAADCIVTSPPYFGLRDYGVDGQYGLESSPAEYVEHMRALFAELRRVLADNGTLWLNLGDSYSSRSDGYNRGRSYTDNGQPMQRPRVSGEIPKNLRGIPWRVALALQADGWILRSDIIWAKSRVDGRRVGDRPTSSHEYIFLLAKQRFYHYASDDKDPDVWSITPGSPRGIDHLAPMPVELAQRCILAGCKPGGTVLDPFSGSGTTGRAAIDNGRNYIGIDINAEYLDLSLAHPKRLGQPQLFAAGGAA